MKVKKITIYVLTTLCIVLTTFVVLGITGKLSLNTLVNDEIPTVVTKEKEVISDVEVKYVERTKWAYYDREDYVWEEFVVTAYTANDSSYPQGTNNILATGLDVDRQAIENLPIAASNCLPLYSVVEVEGIGGIIILDKGRGYKNGDEWEDENWIDIMISADPNDKERALLEYGKQKLKVRVLNYGVKEL